MADAFSLDATSNAVGTLMVRYLVKPIERRLCYLFRQNKIVEELREKKTILAREQTQVQEEVNEAKMAIRTQVIEEDVEDWLTKAEKMLNDVQILEVRREENKRCFRWCPNWCWRYKLSKEIEKKTLAIIKLVEYSSEFKRYGRRAELPSLEVYESEDYLLSKSATDAFNEIMEALKDDKVNMIGVFGTGGVGKTTLVQKVGSVIKSNKHEIQPFKRVVFVTVSQSPEIGKIQQKIADFVDLRFEKTTQEGKAGELWSFLEKEETTFIILDDMWEEFNLRKIGIPLAENHKGCRIIFTTRLRQVCVDMKSVIIPLDVLDEDETWNLFKMKASLDERKADAETIKVAEEVAKECKGLPVAIVTLARALKDTKNVGGWKLALKKLKKGRLMEMGNSKEREKNAYVCLKMSYDYLNKKTTKRCFLLCALFPEDHSIDVEEELVRYACGLELYGKDTSIDDVRCEVGEAIDFLKDSCLLLEDGQRYVKVHDVVRDVARWIASKEDNGLLIDPEVPLGNEYFEEKLEILLHDSYKSETPIQNFERMRALKVLSLTIADSFFSLTALKHLTNLRALELINSGIRHPNDWLVLNGISTFKDLTSLEILSFRHLMFKESMETLRKLKKLRVLDIRSCRFFPMFLPNLIQNLVNIEELYLDNLDEGIGTHVLGKLSFLPSLASLWLELPSPGFPEGFSFPRLERYTININRKRFPYPKRVIPSRSLNLSGVLPSNVFQELLQNVEFLEVEEIKEIKCLTNITTGNVTDIATIFQTLKHLEISSCENLQVVFQMEKAENRVLSQLNYLRLQKLPDLENIWKMPTQHVSLRSLETIELHECGKLRSLFTFSLAKTLDRLEKLKVVGCDKLEQIVEDLRGDEQGISPNMNPDQFLCLPKLSTLEIERCDSLEYIFPNLMAPQGLRQLRELRMAHLPRLKQIRKAANERVESGIQLHQHRLLLSLTELKVSHCPELSDATVHLKPVKTYLQGIQASNLKEVSFTDTKELSLDEISDYNLILEEAREGLNQLTSFEIFECNSLEYLVDTTKKHGPNTAFCNLVELSMSELGGLKAVCNGQIPNGFLQNLKRLSVEECGKLEEVFQIDELKENQSQVLSNLQRFELSKLSELRWIFKGPTHYFSLQSLKVVKISGCEKLKSLFPPSLTQSLQQLEKLEVENCEELKNLFGEQGSEGETESSSNIHPLCLPRLRYLHISTCGSLQYYVLPITLAQGLTHLESFMVSKCPRLKQVFGVAGEDDGDGKRCINLPRLESLRLYKLTDLRSFGPENYSFKAPVLEDLFVEECPQLMKFSIQEVNHNTWILLLQEVPLFAFKELRNAKSLDLIKVLDQENLISGVNIEGEKCKDLEYLVDTTREHMPTSALLTNVVNLCLIEMNGLKMLCNGQPPKGFLQHLELLDLRSLPEFRWIAKGPTQYVNLGNLKGVWIKRCNKLKSLFTFSLIPSLTLLETLEISECDELETIFGELESDDETESNLQLTTTQEFPRLQSLYLLKLRNLKSFGPQNYSIKAPALEDLTVSDCPKLSSFSIQRDKSLQTKETEECIDDRECCNSQLREKSPNLQYPTVNNFEQLFLLPFGYMCKAPTQVVVSNLIRELWISDLERLTQIFTLMLVRNLPNLTVVRVSSCKKLEQIIVNDDMSTSSSSQGHDQDETGIKNDKEKVRFAQLKTLELQNLPSLWSFSPIGYHMVYPSLDLLKITGCSQLITSFTMDSTLCVHAQTKAPQQERSTANEETDDDILRKDIQWRRVPDLRYSLGRGSNSVMKTNVLPLCTEESEEISLV